MCGAHDTRGRSEERLHFDFNISCLRMHARTREGCESTVREVVVPKLCLLAWTLSVCVCERVDVCMDALHCMQI